jgi:peptide/nickel transport system ATP-binding protein
MDLQIRRGETLGIVGESGCGKSTLAQLLMGMLKPSTGACQRTNSAGGMQMVFQDPLSRSTRVCPSGASSPSRCGCKTQQRARTPPAGGNLAQQVGIRAEYLDRLPHAFSGGQRQRIAIARALSSDPDIIVLDEPTSALDISVQAQILNLLVKLQQQRNLTYVLISHNVSVVRHMSDRVAVMYLGQIVELGPARQVLSQPRHPYTRLLLDSVPRTGEPLDDSLALRKRICQATVICPQAVIFAIAAHWRPKAARRRSRCNPPPMDARYAAGVKSPDANCSFPCLFTRLCLCGTACAADGFCQTVTPHRARKLCHAACALYRRPGVSQQIRRF